MKQEFEKTKRFLEQSKVVGHLFCSVMSGRDSAPLVVGVLMANSEQGVADLHVKSMSYRTQYLDNFAGPSSGPGACGEGFENRLTKETFDTRKECLESLFANNQQLLESLYPALGGHRDSAHSENQVMGSEDVGVVRLPLKEVTLLCQVG